MKRVRLAAALAVSALLLSTAAVSADVKMQQKTQVKFEGMLGRMMNLFGGKAAKDGIVQTVSVQGDRKATISGDSISLDFIEHWHTPYKHVPYTGTRLN